MNTKELDEKYIAGTYNRFDAVFTDGKGSVLTDADGKQYIDFGSGIAVAGLGYANAEWLAAVTAQAARLPHASNLFYTEPSAELAKMLCERTGMSKVFFCNSGTEANECAIKVARKYAVESGKTAKPEIITLQGSFHGRTLAALTATGQDSLHPTCFAPYVDGFKYAKPNDFNSFCKVVNDNTAAVMIEVVQGEGGVNALDKAYLIRLAEFCKKEGILLIADEVQCGNGRTGTLYAYEQYYVSPDVVTTAKGLGNGLPIGAVLLGDKVKDVLKKGDHGSTFGANPVACAGACAVLKQIDKKLLDGVKLRNKIITDKLEGAEGVKSVSGLGLMLGIQCDDAKGKADECLKRGLVVLTAHDKIRLLPALNIDIELLNKGLDILKEVLK